MKPIAEIPSRPPERVRAGTLRRSDLETFERLLGNLDAGVVLVTGAGDGRQVVSTGLASAAAAAGRRTALVECDLEEPMLADTLGLAEEPGLAEYLTGDAEAAEILQPLVLAGPAARGDAEPLVCVVGGRSEDGEPRLDSGSFPHAVEKLRHGYGLVVLQGPPLGDGSGALQAAAAQADALLACVGPALVSGRSGRKLRRAIGKLPAPRAEVAVYG